MALQGHAVAGPQVFGSRTRTAPSSGRNIPLNDKSMPDMGARQSRISAHQEANISQRPSNETAHESLRNGKTATVRTGARDASCSLKPAVVPPLDASTSSHSAISHKTKQHHRVSEARLAPDPLHRRDFEVKRIRDRKPVNGVILFSVRWKSTWVPLEAIIHGSEHECSYVEADGTKWYIRKELEIRVNDGVQERKVQWASTWEPLENMANAQEAISTFEVTRQQGLDDERRVQQRTVLTIAESNFPRGIVRSQSEHDYAASQRWVARTWPMIRPNCTLDLYPAIYRIQMELSVLRRRNIHGGKSYRSLMRRPQVRQLLWSRAYIESGKSFHFNRRTRAALFLQVTGDLDTNSPCERCLGEKLAPFVGCVRTLAGQESWLGDACTNCGTQDSSTCPHHRKGMLGRGKSIF